MCEPSGCVPTILHQAAAALPAGGGDGSGTRPALLTNNRAAPESHTSRRLDQATTGDRLYLVPVSADPPLLLAHTGTDVLPAGAVTWEFAQRIPKQCDPKAMRSLSVL